MEERRALRKYGYKHLVGAVSEDNFSANQSKARANVQHVRYPVGVIDEVLSIWVLAYDIVSARLPGLHAHEAVVTHAASWHLEARLKSVE